jgi:hypothetical protein
MKIPRIIERIGLKLALAICVDKQLMDNPSLLYTYGNNFCEATLTGILGSEGYRPIPPESGEMTVFLQITDDSIRKAVTDRFNHSDGSTPVCSGKQWMKGNKIVYVCDWGIGTPIVATNIPNKHSGDYDPDGNRIHYASEGCICSYLYDKGFSPISPLEIVKMYKRKEL